MIHLAGPVVLAAVLAGAGVYGMLARRNAVLILIGAELLLNAAGLVLVTASALPVGGLAALRAGATGGGDPLVSGMVLTVMLVTIAAAEIGVALAVVLLLYRRRATSDVTAVRELGQAAPGYQEDVGQPVDRQPDSPLGGATPGGAR